MNAPDRHRADYLKSGQERVAFNILSAVSLSHFLNDMLQSLIPAIYPLIKSSLSLSFTQIGLITLVYQTTASLLQPAVGIYTDINPKPFSLSIGMASTLTGLIVLSIAPGFSTVLLAVALVGMGSSVFHPESSRVARMASAGKYGLAQSVFQVGGNAGTAMGPLLAAAVIIKEGQRSIAWFSIVALIGMMVLMYVGKWYKKRLIIEKSKGGNVEKPAMDMKRAVFPLMILLILMFSKFFYSTSLTSYYIFYLISKFNLSIKSSQIHLFVFLAGVALGTMLGGPIGDRIGRKRVIWFSIFGAAPFSLVLPYAGLFLTGILTFIIGMILSSAFPAMIVYAQELFPGRVGMVSGLFFGLAFGMAGIGAAVLGKMADMYGIDFVYHLCSFLPLLGILAVFLPDLGRPVKVKQV